MDPEPRPLTPAQIAYLEAFEEWLHLGKGREHSYVDLRKSVLFDLVMTEAGVDPWRVLGRPQHRVK